MTPRAWLIAAALVFLGLVYLAWPSAPIQSPTVAEPQTSAPPLPVQTVESPPPIPKIESRSNAAVPAYEPPRMRWIEPDPPEPAEETPPTPTAVVSTPVPETRVQPGLCDHLGGLPREICAACGDSTGLRRAFCEGSTTSIYCADKRGKDPDCPEELRSDPA